jgi:5-methylcytosine-specific restriction protein A
MPFAPLAFCSQPGCSERVASGRCTLHRREQQREHDHLRFRESAAKRGYDRQWRRLRERILFQFPLCLDCKERGELTLSYEVHHVVKISDAPHLRLDPNNLRALCRPCHTARSARGE